MVFDEAEGVCVGDNEALSAADEEVLDDFGWMRQDEANGRVELLTVAW